MPVRAPERRLEGHRSQKPSLLRVLPGPDCTCSEPGLLPANLRGKCWVVDTSVPSLCCKNVTPLQLLAPREDRSGGKTAHCDSASLLTSLGVGVRKGSHCGGNTWCLL